MRLQPAGAVAGLLGGLCWVIDGFATLAVLHWIGLVLLGLALAGAGAGLVSTSATWLRLIVGVALPVLAWSVLEVAHDSGDPVRIDAVLGGTAVVIALLGLARVRSRRVPHASGSHSRH